MTLQPTLMLTLQVSIVMTVFSFCLRATNDVLGVLGVLRTPSLLARALVAMFGIMPVTALVTGAFALRESVEVVLVAIAVSPHSAAAAAGRTADRRSVPGVAATPDGVNRARRGSSVSHLISRADPYGR